MEHLDALLWKHTTTLDSRRHGEPLGVDLFDDERPGSVSIYQRFKDGTRFPARTVSGETPDNMARVLSAWTCNGVVNDYRGRNPHRDFIVRFDRDFNDDKEVLVAAMLRNPHLPLADTACEQVGREFRVCLTKVPSFIYDPASFRIDEKTGHYYLHFAVAYEGSARQLDADLRACIGNPVLKTAGKVEVLTPG